MSVRNLEPKAVWNKFEDLNAVPRPSKQEERVIQFAKEFGENLGFETKVDAAGNVMIKKPATAGMENRMTLILQAHLDMVHQKNAETDFDFNSQGIQSYIDGDWVKAKGTTLGADNGMGVATIMALLESTDIPHPEFTALFTIDEETGMTGAFELDGSMLSGDILLNLDTEDDDELCIGCAGGIDTNVSWKYNEADCLSNAKGFKISVKRLKGGHSGMDIVLERGNANKIMNRILFIINSKMDMQIQEIDGGSLRNAIPRESFASIAITNEDKFKSEMDSISAMIRKEFATSEPDLSIEFELSNTSGKGMSADDQNKLLKAITSLHNGVYRMDQNIEGLVETSSSLARIIVKDGEFTSQSLQRSSVESAKMDVANTIRGVFELIGATVENRGSYPGWQPNPNSPILGTMRKLYSDMFNEEARVEACHAGLECGILGEHLPGTDMISFGPTIKNPHSPDEKVSISSVQKFWKFFLAVLENIPTK